ncbi:MAG: PfkB family carbohydrate kinase [bacterium]|nr:hypothetical protein [Gammaproteobacteria bacterium]
MKSVLVCGSIATDVIGTYAGSFTDYEEKYPTTGLNISLQLQTLKSSFGGCGINITYGLNQLGVSVIPVSSAGLDFEDHYRQHLEGLGINCRYISVDAAYDNSAQCIIFSDLSGNQITAFHAGASVSETRSLPRDVEHIDDVALAILAPEDAPIMLKQARDLNALNIPIMLDPGQGVAEFNQPEIEELLSLSQYVITNAHEWEILQTNVGLTEADIRKTHHVIVTLGKGGVDIFPGHTASAEPIHVDAAPSTAQMDATGCGDAFRAGYAFGLMQGKDPGQCGELGCLMATFNLEARYTQHYQVTRQQLLKKRKLTYG